MAETRPPWVTITHLDDAIPSGTDLRVAVPERVVSSYLDLYAGEAEAIMSRPALIEVTGEVCSIMPGGIVETRYRPVLSMTPIAGFSISGGLIRLDNITAWYRGITQVLSYTAGWDHGRLAAVRGAVVARTVRSMVKYADDALGVSGVSEEGHSDDYIPEGWTDDERATLEGLRRRVGA